ncbi:MAG: 16S rRNA (cytidine(1402)-2'-O)-methyltransferase [Cellvibrionaceae bacterium]|nr:16S rRNA (cytidine(1402)-2'-O)-methyltransferase [Cellvibrionaceae bacterium]
MATNAEPCLYIVATPIGNLADISQRALEVLAQVDRIAAEDTRHSARLCQHFGIDTPLVAYHDHSDEHKTQALLDALATGQQLALISDAGTPLISDPGYRLVKLARDAGIKVVPVPGACAMAAALSVAGLPSNRFCFEGFLPAKAGARSRALAELAKETRTLIFYEAPHRIEDCLADMVATFGFERELVLARELTKTFETLLAGSAAEVLAQVRADPNQRKGEMVILVHGAEPVVDTIEPEAERIMECLLAELSLKQAASLGAEITGLRKKVLYQWALDQKPD